MILHCDINEMRAVGEEPAHAADLRELFARHPRTSIIHAHTGLGRFVGPTASHVALLDEMCRDHALDHVAFDISWDEVAKWVVKDGETVKAWADLINRHSTRFLFGTDAVAPKSQEAYLKTYHDYDPLWKLLTPEASRAVRLGNYERLVDAARRKVRAWEAENLGDENADAAPATIPIRPAEPAEPARKAADNGIAPSGLAEAGR